jgi:hypothetical protein
LTTEGNTFAATSSTLPAGAFWSGVLATCDDVVGVLLGLLASSSISAEYAAAPPIPAPPPTTSDAAMTAAANLRRPR